MAKTEDHMGQQPSGAQEQTVSFGGPAAEVSAGEPLVQQEVRGGVITTPVSGAPEQQSFIQRHRKGLGITAVAAILGAGGAYFLTQGGSSENAVSSAPSDQESSSPSNSPSNSASQAETPKRDAPSGEQVATLPALGTELPNSPDTPTLVNQIFTKINLAYKTGNTAYLNDAVLSNRAQGQDGLQTPIGQYFAQDVEAASLKASNYADVYGKDPDGPKRFDEKTLAADTSTPGLRKILIQLTEVDTLGKGEQARDARYWVIYTRPDTQLGGEFLAGTQQLTSKDQADQIEQSPDLLKNWQITG